MDRTIFHVDMDSFFASCEQQANPRLRGKPIAVSGDPKSRTVVAAASKEAKRFGVKSGMTIRDARRLCPQIEFILGNPDRYVTVSRSVFSILESYTPDAEIFSIDEAFMDVTGWADRAGGVLAMAFDIKRRIRACVGEWTTCSIGIASNKRLAKLASDFDKPDGIVLVTDNYPLSISPSRMEGEKPERGERRRFSRSCPQEGEMEEGVGSAFSEHGGVPRCTVHILSRAELLTQSKLRDLCGIGSRIEARLAAMGITTIADLATTPVRRLVEEFGVYGYDLHDMALGEDASLVRAIEDEPKSIGHAATLPRDLHTLAEVRPVVDELAEKVAARLRRHGFEGSTVHLQIRFHDFSRCGEQRTLRTATDDGLRISREVTHMLQRHALSLNPGGGDRGGGAFAKPVRLVGVSVGALRPSRPAQLLLFPHDERWRAATHALDAVNDRYGDWTLQRASLLRPERFLRKVAAAFRATAHLRSGG